MKELVLNNLSVGYESKAVVSDINASVSPGEILTLLGCNGSGKSTTLMTVAGLLPVINGSVEADGRRIDSIPEKERARIMSVLLPDDVKQKGISVREIVALGRYPYTGYFGRLTKEDDIIVDEVIEMAGVSALAETDYGKLSDGQRQRVRLSRCLAQEPEILILDEPTIFLDVNYQTAFTELLMHLAKEKQIAVVMSIHDPELAVCCADRILSLKNGMVHAYGTPEELVKNGSLRSLYELDKLTAELDTPSLKNYAEQLGNRLY